ncbi:phosphatidylinositol phosphatase PTPRQ isoform X4 [Ambystoma mexicanum]|uniref:phosphatidylinositol phosphatase PTPRQ isoform X4 n=1 Tax=Ambystoma mexicanum TaxID=8296 RepID=UPI0037E940C8
MDKAAAASLLFVITCASQAAQNLDCGQRKEQTTAVFAEWKDFPKGENPEFYLVTYRLMGSALQKNVTHIVQRKVQNAVILMDELDERETYNITIESMKRGAILSSKSFLTRGISEASINTVVSTTAATFHINPLTRDWSISVSLNNSSRNIQSDHSIFQWDRLKPGTRYKFVIEFRQQQQEFINITQKKEIEIATGLCSEGWLSFKDSCYKISKDMKTWQNAQNICQTSQEGAHLVDINTIGEYIFISSYLQTINHIVMIWSGLNDLKKEGELLWTDGSSYDLETSEITPASLIPSNESDCYALQQNATGPNYFFTGFFCYIRLPYLCEYSLPSPPENFTFDLEEVTETEATFVWSDLQSWLGSGFGPVLLYDSEESFETLPLSATRKTIARLSPGNRHRFMLSASNNKGARINLSPILWVETRPFHPQHVVVKNISSTEIVLQWDPPRDSFNASIHAYIVSIFDVEEHQWNTTLEDKSKTSTVIRNVKPYHQYRIHLQSIAEGGTLSCREPSLVLVTGVSPPVKVWVDPESVGEDYLVLQWQPAEEEHQFQIQVKPYSSLSRATNYSTNGTNMLRIGSLIPGVTYEMGVAAVQNGSMSEMKTIRTTLKPMPVRIAVPYEIKSKSIVLFVQMPSVGSFDGILLQSRGRPNTTLTLKTDGKIKIENLIPGLEYDFYILTISGLMLGSAYELLAVKTCLSSPVNVHEGEVTETSIQVVWDRADGHFQQYEITCINCAAAFLVQKVLEEIAVFSNLIPGTHYNFSVRTEKEHFKDSESVFIETQTVPSPARYLNYTKATTSITVEWYPAQGRFDGYIISIKNESFFKDDKLCPSQRNYQFSGLYPGSDYLIGIVTVSIPKKSRPNTILVGTNPNPPSDLQVFGQEENTVYLSWKLPRGGFDAFQLSYYLVDNSDTVLKSTVHGSRARVDNLAPGVEYMFQMKTIKGQDTSVPVAKRVITKPPGICGLSVQFINTTSATFTWNPTTGSFTHYKIYLSNDTYAEERIALPSVRAYKVTGLTPGGNYNFTVQRVTSEVEGSMAFVDIVAEPEAPRGLEAFNISSHSFSLRWRQPRGRVESYRVDLVPRHGLVALRARGGGRYQADVFGTTPGASYTITLSSVSSSASSSPVSKSVTTNETIPGAPVSLGGERVGSAGILLSWSIPPNTNGKIVSYNVKYKEVCPWMQSVYSQEPGNPDTLEVLLTNLNPGTTYEIKVAAENSAGIGLYSEPLLFQTAESAPGKVVNLTVEAVNSTAVNMTWFLPRQPNGKITSFRISVKHARTGAVAKDAVVKVEDILGVRVPECNDKGESFLWSTTSPTSTRGQSTTTSPSTSSLSTMSSSRISSVWNQPITYVVDLLRPYTTYLFEVSAVTIEPGYIDSAIIRTPESVPEDPPQNLAKGNITGKSFSLTWDPPTIPTGKFSYRVELYGPLGRLLDNSTKDLKFTFTNLTPFTTYDAHVSGETSAGVGPKSSISVFTPSEAPSAVSDLKVKEAEASLIAIVWRRPLQPNGVITQYRVKATVKETGATIENTLLTDTPTNSSDPYVLGDASVSIMLAGAAVVPVSVLYEGSAEMYSTASTALPVSFHSPAGGAAAAASGAEVLDSSSVAESVQYAINISAEQLSYVVKKLVAFTEYTISVSAFTIMGEGPPTSLTVRTREQVPSSVERISYENVSSTSILLFWDPPLKPNGMITHYTVYAMELDTKKTLRVVTGNTSYLITGLRKYTDYKMRVTASTTAGESSLSEENDIFVRTLEDEPGSPPQNLMLIGITARSVSLEWAPPSETNGIITHYEVLYRNSTGLYAQNTSLTTMSLNYLKPYTLYNISVRAYTRVGHGNQSTSALPVRTLETAPGSPPYDLSYRNINSTQLEVSWKSPVHANGVILFYTVRYWNRSHVLNITSNYSSVVLSDLRKYSKYELDVSASTMYGNGNQISSVLNMTTLEDVPDDPPHNLSYSNLSSSSVRLFYFPPSSPNGVITYYTVSCVGADGTVWSLNSSYLFVVLSGLNKYSDYSLTVSASTSVGSGPQTSKPLFVRTDEDAPDSAPENVTYRNISSTEVIVSFLPPAIPNGIITWYTIYLQRANGTEPRVINTTHLSENIKGLKKYTAYTVEVSASTVKGEGVRRASMNILTEEDAPSSPPRSLSVKQLSDVIVKLSWKPPLEPNGIILYYTVRVWNDISSRNINTSETSLLLTDLENNNDYSAYITASTRFGPGNVKTQTAKFRTQEGAPSDPPRNVSYTNLTSTSILVSWSPPSKPNGLIQYYTIYYKNLSHILMQNFTNDDIGVEPENVSLSAILENLATFSSYTLWITSSTSMGDGNQTSDPVHVYTDEDIPGDSVRNLTVLSRTSQSILLSWLPPLKPNGHLTRYELTFDSNQSLQILPGLSFTSFNLLGLEPFTKYQISIVAKTVVGKGPAIWATVATEESIPDGPVENLAYQNISSTTVNVSWYPPTKPNGLVIYRVLLSLTTPRVDPSPLMFVTHENSKLIEGLKKYSDYILEITPGTQKGYAESYTLELFIRTQEDVPESAPIMNTYRNLTSTSVLLTWDPPLLPSGIVKGYDCHLKGPDKNVNFTTSNHSLLMQDLLPFTLYRISIAAKTQKGPGPAGNFTFHTDESVPESSPQNLTLINCTTDTVWLKWHPTPRPNGIIRIYNFKIWENGTDSIFYRNISGAFTEAQLNGLEPFTTYFVSASAFTKFGNGDFFSNAVMFTTKESAPDIVQNVHCTANSWQSILVQWDPPSKPNGLVTHYIIVFQSSATTVSAHDRVHTFRELLANTTYHFTIRAATSAGIGEERICHATTPPEEVPSVPKDVSLSNVSSTSVTLRWIRPDNISGYLRNYKITSQLQSSNCSKWETAGCVQHTQEHYAYGDDNLIETTITELKKFRWYRFKVAASTSSGYGSSSAWIVTQTLAGTPEAPPENVTVMASSNHSIIISWKEPAVITGPTSYLINVSSVDSTEYNKLFHHTDNESTTLEVFDLKPFTRYSVVVIAVTGDINSQKIRGAYSNPVITTTLEAVPKDPPKNITFQKMPNDVTKFQMTFMPPSEPNGPIQVYQAMVYAVDDPANTQIRNLTIINYVNNSITAVIEGLKGGHTYKISVYAVNGAGAGPNMQLKVTMDTKEPPLPTKRPVPVYDSSGTLIVSSTTITIRMPICYFNDNHGPIKSVQVLVAEAAVQHEGNVTKWHEAYFKKPKPYFTNEGFPNPECPEGRQRFQAKEEVYVIGADNNCMLQGDEDKICNGPLKPRKQYVFKFRATNRNGQFTDSEYSEVVKTLAEGLSERAVEIILSVTLCVLSIILLVAAIYAFARIRQKQKEGGTYSPRDAEIIDTKFKLDQLITVADLELKDERLTRLLSYRKSLKPISKKAFLQHVEELCTNNNLKFQEEFAELPKFLHDLATSDADLPWNRSKNRFTNIKPYNNNRVKLMADAGVPGSDYINASYVSGYICPNEFIATQGPLPGTVGDFWRMVWETKAKTIVMLSQCFEKGRIRCHQYWPEDNKPVTVFGDLVITKLTEDVQLDWTVRDLKVEKHGDFMMVRQCNFTSWPEHGVPESATPLIHFVKLIRANRPHENTPIVVHCSAGVGRTGLYVALDHLAQHINHHDFVDIYGLVAELRSERMCMVQNLAQYIFLHQCVLDLLTTKGSNQQAICFVNYSALQKMDSLEAMEGDVELEWEETTM